MTELVNRGARAHVGAHGESPKGHNYHAEMHFLKQGGMSNYKALECATRSAAITLGLNSAVGSIEEGKLADLVVFPPDINLLEDLSKSEFPRWVAKGGRVWEASTLSQIWPLQQKGSVLPHLNIDHVE